MSEEVLEVRKPLDRVTEAYFDEMGTEFGNQTRNRIHWVCEKAEGENILDVGCSQGITSILLGREGKSVLGIDLLKESIVFAEEALHNESELTKKYVGFKNANFIEESFDGIIFDSIIFGEVLEHITDPKRFIKKAGKLISENGSIIVTVPFGINDYFDHKKTYYLNDLLNLQVEDLVMTDIKFFGKWVGAVYHKGKSNKSLLDQDMLKALEANFYQVERSIMDNILNNNNKSESELGIIQQNGRNASDQGNLPLNNLIDEEGYEKEINKLKENENSLKEKIKKLEKQNKNKLSAAEKKFILEKKKKVQSDKLLLDAYNKEERLLKTHSSLLKRYEALKTSKLGNLTINYWKWRRKYFGGKTSGSKINRSATRNN